MTLHEEKAVGVATPTAYKETMSENSAPSSAAGKVLDAALSYAARGWKVFPLHSVDERGECTCGKAACDRQGKHPRVRNGFKDATLDEVKVREWFGAGAEPSNLGIATGEASGITVIDIDVAEGKRGAETWMALIDGHGEPQTLMAETGSGGTHVYFAYNSALKNGTNVLGPGIDCRNDGGYIVAPPSVHRSGGVYTWLNEFPLLSLPAFLTRPLKARKEVQHQPGDLEALASAVDALDPDDRDTWLKVVWGVADASGRSDEGWRIVERWASRSKKYKAGETRDLFYRESDRVDGKVTAGTVFHMARERGWHDPRLLPDSDHNQIADHVVARMSEEGGARPVYSLGNFWFVSGGLWRPMDVDAMAAKIGTWFGGLKLCRRASDFKQVAWVTAQKLRDDRFFEGAAVGVAGPKSFWRVDEGGNVCEEPLTAEHRMRMLVAAEPDFAARAPRFDALLGHAFGEDEAQRDLLQCLFGAALTRSLWRYRVAALFLGVTTSGKTTLLQVLRSLFPTEQVSATNPANWESEYYLANLAGRALNIVGELDEHRPLPSAAFKNVVGNDLLEGRHPSHQPFSFVSMAGHFFNGNALPPTRDRSDAFFRRWRVVVFRHTVTDDMIVPDLAERIVKEETGAVLAWMLVGAAKVARHGHLPTTPDHDAAIAKWRAASNSALQFVLDPEWCALDAASETPGPELYVAYREWAAAAGVRTLGRNKFIDALADGGGRHGVRRVDAEHRPRFVGVKLVGRF